MFDSIRTIPVRVRPPYDVRIGSGLLGRCGDYLAALLGQRRIAVLADDTVASLYLDTVTAALEDAGFAVCSHMIRENKYKTHTSRIPPPDKTERDFQIKFPRYKKSESENEVPDRFNVPSTGITIRASTEIKMPWTNEPTRQPLDSAFMYSQKHRLSLRRKNGNDAGNNHRDDQLSEPGINPNQYKHCYDAAQK